MHPYDAYYPCPSQATLFSGLVYGELFRWEGDTHESAYYYGRVEAMADRELQAYFFAVYAVKVT